LSGDSEFGQELRITVQWCPYQSFLLASKSISELWNYVVNATRRRCRVCLRFWSWI